MKATLNLVLALSSIGLSSAFPYLNKRVYTVNDADILNFALTLEHLEDKFYREGLLNFTQQAFLDAGYTAEFYQNIVETSHDETAHVDFLTGALNAIGNPAVKECTYAFGVTSVQAFIATASILEGVGVSAYLGAAGLISSKAYLGAAASILTVEARHNAYIRAAGLHQRPAPQPYDAPLTYDEVHTMAFPFFTGCPADNPTFLPVKAFPSLIASSAGIVKTGSTVTLTTNKADGMPFKIASGPLYAAWIGPQGPIFVPAVPKGDMLSWDVVVPAGIHGQSYVLLTGCNDRPVTDDNVTAGPTIVEVQGSDGSPNLLP